MKKKNRTDKKPKPVVIETAVGRVIVSADSANKLDMNTLTAAPKHPRHSTKVSLARSTESFDALDLHGATTDEVEPLLGDFLDRALIDSRYKVHINHGKGSGRVRTEVRRILAAHPSVSRFEFALPSEGSFGVTVAYLK